MVAQTPKEEVKQQSDEIAKRPDDRDCLLMKNNKMFVLIKGQMTAMTDDYTLKTGDVVTREGKVVMKDGSSKQMKNGDCITLTGVWSHERDNEKIKTPEDATDPDQ